MITLLQLLKLATEQNASDLHIVAGSPPCLRVEGRIIRVKTESLTAEDCRRLCYAVLDEKQKSKFEQKKELDFSFDVKDVSRFRGNYFFQKNAVSGVFRRVPMSIPNYTELGLPPQVPKLTNLPYGLVLVTGPTGSGKSTTIASLVNKINSEREGHILTLEDPIEFIHSHRNCIVNQREIGIDSINYAEGLKHLLRQDPDFCVIGEMRDVETIETALKVAETGHLVFATLHTNSAVQTINRLVSVFPAEQQERVRVLLSFTLQAVVSQRLVPTVSGKRIMACEFLLLNSGIRNLIREGKLHQIQNLMEVGQEKSGMITLNQSLSELVKSKRVSEKEAYLVTNNPDELFKLLQRGE
jgi:twitching motility protein PilT